MHAMSITASDFVQTDITLCFDCCALCSVWVHIVCIFFAFETNFKGAPYIQKHILLIPVHSWVLFLLFCQLTLRLWLQLRSNCLHHFSVVCAQILALPLVLCTFKKTKKQKQKTLICEAKQITQSQHNHWKKTQTVYIVHNSPQLSKRFTPYYCWICFNTYSFTLSIHITITERELVRSRGAMPKMTVLKRLKLFFVCVFLM